MKAHMRARSRSLEPTTRSLCTVLTSLTPLVSQVRAAEQKPPIEAGGQLLEQVQ